ncbi:MAG: C39 family peptidase [bacterium]
MKRTLFGIFLLFLLAAGWLSRSALRDAYDGLTRPQVPTAQPASLEHAERADIGSSANNVSAETASAGAVNTPANTNADDAPLLPAEVNLDVPFTSQAPDANWNLPYQEACEETAALMVHRFWHNQAFASKEDADTAIREVVDFEEKQYGSYKDTTADETARFIRDLWGYTRVDVFKGSEVTIDRIKREVADSNPVIVLANGRELYNPNYRQPGPIYHALVIKGYTKRGMIITNDPGTRKGADYLYDPNVLLNAVHDWNDGDVASGQRVMLIIRGR